MCDALKQLMKPELDEAVDKAVGKAVDKAVGDNTKNMARRMIRAGKYSDAEIADISGLTITQIRELQNTIDMRTTV